MMLFPHVVRSAQRSSGSRGGRTPCPPPRFLQNVQFSGNFKGKTPILSKFWAQGPPLGVKIPLGPPDQNPGSAPERRESGLIAIPATGLFQTWSFRLVACATAQMTSRSGLPVLCTLLDVGSFLCFVLCPTRKGPFTF